MSIIEAIILGVIQGATEFLPVSSSGHLVLLPEIFGWGVADLTFIGVVHLGTLLAILFYFWRDIWQIIVAVLEGIRRRELMGTTDARLGWLIVIGSIIGIISRPVTQRQHHRRRIIAWPGPADGDPIQFFTGDSCLFGGRFAFH